MAAATDKATTEAAGPTATLRVNLQGIQIARKDGALEDDFKTWAHVVLLHPPRTLSKYWYSADAEINLSKTSVTNGFDAAYNYVRQSKPVALSDVAFSELLETTLVVNVFKGGARDAAKGDQLIGYFSVNLQKIITGEKVKGKFKLESPQSSPYIPNGCVFSTAEYSGSIAADIRGDTHFEEFCLGSRNLRLDNVVLANVPKRWRLPASEWEDTEESQRIAAAEGSTTPDPATVLALVEDPEENSHRYVLEVALPAGRTVTMASGVLRYRNFGGTTEAATPAVAISPPGSRPSSGGKEPSGVPAAGRTVGGTWKWQVEWKPALLFLSKSSVADLIKHISTGAMIGGTVRRVATELTEDDDPQDTVVGLEPGRRYLDEDFTYRCQINVPFDRLLVTGVADMATEVSLEPVLVSEEEKASAAAAKTARDASWNEYLAAKAKAGGGKAAGGKKPAAKAGKDAKAKDAKDTKAKDAKAKVAAKKPGKGDKKEEVIEEAAAAPPLHPYVLNGTFLAVRVTANIALRPRVPTPPPPKITASDLIPSRPAALSAPPGLDASQQFRREIANAVSLVAQEYLKVFGGSTGIDAAGDDDAKRRELLGSIKGTGLYDKIKGILKTTTQSIVSERFVHMPGARDPPGSRGRDMFVSYLYSYLVGQMHAALNATFTEADVITSLAPALDGAGGKTQGKPVQDEAEGIRLRRIACECEFAGRYARADRVHQMRITLGEEAAARGQLSGHYDISSWHEYGCFLTRRGEFVKAATCFREALSIDSDFVPSLLALASVQASRNQIDEAHVFADCAASVFRSRVGATEGDLEFTQVQSAHTDAIVNASPIIFGLLSLVLSLRNKPVESGQAALAAISCYRSLLAAAGLDEQECEQAGTGGAVFLQLARFLLEGNYCLLARKALELAGDALTDTDAPKMQQADLLALRCQWFLQSINTVAHRALLEEAQRSAASDDGADQSSYLKALKHPLLYTAGAVEVAISAAGVAYDGAPISPSQCRALIDRAVEMCPEHYGAWWTRATFFLSGVSSEEIADAATWSANTVKRGGCPDIADLSIADLVAAVRDLRVVLSGHPQPIVAPGVSPFLQQQPMCSSTCEKSPFSVSSLSGIGGAGLFEDEYTLVRQHVLLANIYSHLSTVEASYETEELGESLLNNARDQLLTAAQMCKELAVPTAADVEGPKAYTPKPWATILLGLGRVAWTFTDIIESEALFSEANVLDSQNPVMWGYLAYLCLNADPLRDKEAASGIEQSLRLGLIGDDAETTVLLHTIAEKYVELGDNPMAIHLLRRATVHLNGDVSLAHLEAIMHAGIKLAETLRSDGQAEECIKVLKAMSSLKAPTQLPSGAAPIVTELQNVRKQAVALLSDVFARFGRQAELVE